MARGFADLHVHQFANLGFGGRAFWGAPSGDPSTALRPCSNWDAHGPAGVLDLIGNMVKGLSGGHYGPGHLVGGHPQFDGWPRWNSFTHQAVYEDWLHRAVQGGLRLMVMLAVNSSFLASQAARAPGRTADDMEAVDLQLMAAKDLEASIDQRSGGPGRGWYRIVYTPDEAQSVIDAGKLAVLLGIEVDNVFHSHAANGPMTPEQLRAQVDKYDARGVRHLFPIHFANNLFGGASFDKALAFDPSSSEITLRAYPMHTEDGRRFGYEYRQGRRNVQGLTALGESLIVDLIRRGIVIDWDHMSAKSKERTFELCSSSGGYPVVSGHTGFIEISRGDKRHEGQLLPTEIDRLRSLGGFLAPIVNQGSLETISTWREPGRSVVEHTSGATSETFAQGYLYAVSKMRGAPVAIGTDLNGFAGLPGPRFGPERAPGGSRGDTRGPRLSYPFQAAVTGRRLDRSVVGQRTFDFNEDGLAHVGMLPDLIADLRVLGVSDSDLDPLLNSAQGYVDMWRRAWAHRRTEPLFGLWSHNRGDNFVTTHPTWAGPFIQLPVPTRHDYSPTGIMGRIFSPDKPQPSGTVPLHTWWSPGRQDNWTTSNPQFVPGRALNPDYQYVGHLGYVYDPNRPAPAGTVTLHSWWSPSRGDNFLTAQANSGFGPDYVYVRREGYLPA